MAWGVGLIPFEKNYDRWAFPFLGISIPTWGRGSALGGIGNPSDFKFGRCRVTVKTALRAKAVAAVDLCVWRGAEGRVRGLGCMGGLVDG